MTTQPQPLDSQEAIRLPKYVTGLVVSGELLVLLQQCVDEAPLSKAVRDRIEGEFQNAIKNAVKPLVPSVELNGVPAAANRVSELSKADSRG